MNEIIKDSLITSVAVDCMDKKYLVQFAKEVKQTGDGNTPLIYAALEDGIQSAKNIIDEGADVNEGNHAGVTPLMFAAMHQNSDMVDFLLGNGAKVNATSNNGSTALMFAAPFGYVCITNSLIKAGALVALADDDGDTALKHAVDANQHETVAILENQYILESINKPAKLRF